VSEVVPCTDFEFDVSIESGPVVFYRPGWDMLFTVVCDDGGEVLCGGVYVGEVVNVEICKGSVDAAGEVVPVSAVVIGVCAFGGCVVGTVE